MKIIWAVQKYGCLKKETIILSFWDISDAELIQSCLKYLGCSSVLYDSLNYKWSIMLHYFKSSMVLQIILYTRSWNDVSRELVIFPFICAWFWSTFITNLASFYIFFPPRSSFHPFPKVLTSITRAASMRQWRVLSRWSSEC